MVKAAATYQILVVDDSAVSRKLVEHALEASDYSLLFAKSSQEALDLFRRHSPSVVLTDWMFRTFPVWSFANAFVHKPSANIPMSSYSAPSRKKTTW